MKATTTRGSPTYHHRLKRVGIQCTWRTTEFGRQSHRSRRRLQLGQRLERSKDQDRAQSPSRHSSLKDTYETSQRVPCQQEKGRTLLGMVDSVYASQSSSDTMDSGRRWRSYGRPCGLRPRLWTNITLLFDIFEYMARQTSHNTADARQSAVFYWRSDFGLVWVIGYCYDE